MKGKTILCDLARNLIVVAVIVLVRIVLKTIV